MSGRKKFVESERTAMWKFLITELRKKNTQAYSPCGLQIWDKYIQMSKSTRQVSNLASHFRKQMQPSLHAATLSIDEKIFIYRSLEMPVEPDARKLMESAHNVKIKFKLGTNVPRGFDKNAETNDDTEEERRIDSDDSDAEKDDKNNEQGDDDDEPIQLDDVSPKATVANSALDLNASMANTDDHNYTLELKDLKKQCRVRHDLPTCQTRSQAMKNEVVPVKKRRTSLEEQKCSVLATHHEVDEKQDSDLSLDSFFSHDGRVDLNMGRIERPSSSDLQDGQHHLLSQCDDDDIGSTRTPPTPAPLPEEILGRCSPVADENPEEENKLRENARRLLLKACNLDGPQEDVKQAIEAAEVKLFKEAKSWSDYKKLLVEKVRENVAIRQLFQENIATRNATTDDNVVITLKKVENDHVSKEDRAQAVELLWDRFDGLTAYLKTKGRQFVECFEEVAAKSATSKEIYADRMKTIGEDIWTTLNEELQSGGSQLATPSK